MARFTVLLQSQPEKYYRKTDRKTAGALKECFKKLEENPFFLPGRIEKLHGYQNLYRYRAGGLRVVYEISEETSTIGVVAVFPRGDIYKKIRE